LDSIGIPAKPSTRTRFAQVGSSFDAMERFTALAALTLTPVTSQAQQPTGDTGRLQ